MNNPPHSNHPEESPNRKDIALFVADHVKAMLAYWDKNGMCRFANEAYMQWFGKGHADLVNKVTISELLGPELYKKNQPYIDAVLKGIPQHFERELQLPTGEKKQTSASYYPDIDSNTGEVKGFFVHVADITELKKAEEMMRGFSALEARNKELEQFVYVASHDLQEPLRTITSFSERLQKQYHGQMDEHADKYLHYMVESTGRMRELIKGLLDYALIGQNRRLDKVDCNELVKTVIEDLQVKISHANATVTFETLPVLSGNKMELMALFQNLIGNAIKFRKNGVAPLVKITVEETTGGWLFKITDNGIGIDEKDREKVFIIFKRLRNRSEFPGNGIGLAHCKKIVELHHGKIWVDSVCGQGSTFNFTINT